ncbi:hypothetical protein PV08_11250 [Exophiala spinifera]|uniref:Uncharacterized protein n=1 Tax=Exophiala spinifera TaxID=91928 RepID=A0A0D2AU63_9EURO|nr:uncharacterized protein PV08_11250 [Exophiala spinifera]KIW10288.1 hypothetical protein PV08_11250 [Exophiala spinifera]
MPYDFSICKEAVLGIIYGDRAIGSITNETIHDYLWHGPITGLDANSRADFLAITYQGCVKICGGGKIALNDTSKALNIAATWIFPLAILFSLPWDSLHRRKVRRTLEAVSNWLGSPQTALTATIFNFRQIRECHRRVKDVSREMQSTASDTYYTLSCLSQFELPRDKAVQEEMLRVLVRYTVAATSVDDGISTPDTSEKRRHPDPRQSRDLVAFIFSVVLAFAELGDNSTAHSLALGLLLCWLPILVIFTIVDRNPISADRSAELLSRWLHNVHAIREWALNQGQSPAAIAWWNLPNAGRERFAIGDFIGQGRRMQYAGLTSAVIEETEKYQSQFDASIRSFDIVAERVDVRIYRRPVSWWVITVISASIVWLEIMMAFMVAFTTPTVGLGCRSFSDAMLALLSSVSWCLNILFSTPTTLIRIISHFFNAITTLVLIAIIGFQLTGGMNNCWCKASLFNYPLLGGYVDFENAAFYREHFNVAKYWALGTCFGGLVPLLAFAVAVFWWLKCQHLWRFTQAARGFASEISEDDKITPPGTKIHDSRNGPSLISSTPPHRRLAPLTHSGRMDWQQNPRHLHQSPTGASSSFQRSRPDSWLAPGPRTFLNMVLLIIRKR